MYSAVLQMAPPVQAHLSKLKSRDWRKARRKAGFNRFSSLESSLSQIPLPKGEGGPKGRVRGEVPGSSPLTRRFAAPSPFGRGIRPKHFSILDTIAVRQVFDYRYGEHSRSTLLCLPM